MSCFPAPFPDDEPSGTPSRLVGLKKAAASLPVQAKNVHIFPRKTVGKDGETSFLTHFLCTRHFASISFNPHDNPVGQFFVPTLK